MFETLQTRYLIMCLGPYSPTVDVCLSWGRIHQNIALYNTFCFCFVLFFALNECSNSKRLTSYQQHTNYSLFHITWHFKVHRIKTFKTNKINITVKCHVILNRLVCLLVAVIFFFRRNEIANKVLGLSFLSLKYDVDQQSK